MLNGPLIEQLSRFEFKVNHIRSHENQMADFLSRVLFDPFEFDVTESNVGYVLLGRNLALVSM